MTYYSRNGNRFFQTATIPEYTALPAGTYTLKYDPNVGFWFEEIDNFELPKKVYGDLTRYRDRITSTFMSRSAATGVMLAGEKGSGKTLLGKALATHLREEYGIPTIVLNAPWCGDAFNTLVQEMEQPAIFMFDEFEKVYHEDHAQQQVLTLLDGVYPTKKLFLITTNDKWKVDRHMRNRPGRIFYMIDYKGLSKEFINEYTKDNLLDQSKVASVVLVSALFSEFNFDMLKALVEEMNRYGEDAQQAMQMLNAKPEFDSVRDHDVRLFLENGSQAIVGDFLVRKKWTGNPVTGTIMIEYYSTDPNAASPYDGDDDYYDDEPEDSTVPPPRVDQEVVQTFHELKRTNKLFYTSAVFTAADIKKVDGDGKFDFVNQKGECLTLTKRLHPEANYWQSLL